MLGDDESPRHGELARAERLERALAGVGRVRRVEEGDLEPPALGFEPRELPSDVAAHDTRPGLDTVRTDILLERRDRARAAPTRGATVRGRRGPTRGAPARPGEHARGGGGRPRRAGRATGGDAPVGGGGPGGGARARPAPPPGQLASYASNEQASRR